MEARLEKIESKLSLAEDMLEELNKTVYRQQRRIDQLEQAMDALRQQVQTAMPAEPRTADEEIPPHY
jgi:SlyX protein